jgi:probable phosphoglycerate mutase
VTDRDPRLVLVRHGRTDWNLAGRAQGQVDVSLDDVGRAQAKEMAVALSRLAPTQLWTSDLARARETAAFLEEATGLAAVPDPALREYDVGVRSGLTHPEFAERFPAEHAAWEAGLDEPRVEGEESSVEVRERMVPALASYLDQLEPGEAGIAVTHGACLKVALVGLLGWPHEQFRDLMGIRNGGWVVVTRRHRDARVRLAAYNRTAG